MIFKFITIVLFAAAEIALGFYSLVLSEDLLARFLFFILSAVFVCFGVVKFGALILPYKTSEEQLFSDTSEGSDIEQA